MAFREIFDFSHFGVSSLRRKRMNLLEKCALRALKAAPYFLGTCQYTALIMQIKRSSSLYAD
jgi:hypothetical protein